MVSQAMSDDAYLEEYISTNTSCMRVHQPLNKAVHMDCVDVFIIVLVTSEPSNVGMCNTKKCFCPV